MDELRRTSGVLGEGAVERKEMRGRRNRNINGNIPNRNIPIWDRA